MWQLPTQLLTFTQEVYKPLPINPKATYSYEKVTFADLNETYRYSKVTFTDPKVTLWFVWP